MAEKTLVQKLVIKAGNRMLLVNAPQNYAERLAELPEGVQLSHAADGTYDWVQVFVYNKADIDALVPAVIQYTKPGGVLWFAYPKKSGTINTDISRDYGWNAILNAGWDSVTQVAIDDTWSAVRFRPTADIKNMTRKTRIGSG